MLVSQHADSLGAPQACEAAGIPNVSYNGSTESTGPNTFIISSRIDWAPYLKYAINCVNTGSQIATDWTGTIATGSVQLTAIGNKVFKDKAAVQKQLDEVRDKLIDGSLKVFATENWTVNREHKTSYTADVNADPDPTHPVPDTEAIADGYFHESEFRSAPYFDIIIDGITVIDEQ